VGDAQFQRNGAGWAPRPTAATPEACADGWVVRALSARGVSLMKTPASMKTRAFGNGIRGEEVNFSLGERCPWSTGMKLSVVPLFFLVTGSSFAITLFRSSCLLRET
jgi:hypothetical protein